MTLSLSVLLLVWLWLH